ncbi:hypothetical protein LCGC14_1093520 [marine sediment metagenome]|uniref:Histidine kinase/HSP90-like ATPase domain-containing protein n=1 Tax=marine sediment metagenome TaxID=412755 RepID=A0A0F9MG28_9ZZZZ
MENLKVNENNGNGTRREFVPGKQLLKLMMKYQGTDKKKALIEVLQNALDSEATEINICVNTNQIIVQDNGIGMTDEVIRKYFEVIGESSKRNDKTKIGFFGIGVLQMMQYGKLTITTLNKQIEVDVLANGLSYDIEEIDEFYQGTNVVIDLYDEYKMDDWGQSRMLRNIKSVLYMPKIKITMNGKEYIREVKYNTKVKHNDFEAFIENDQISRLFSQGLYVRRMDAYGGISFNSNKKLELNFARNAIIDSDGKKELYSFVRQIEEAMVSGKNRFSKDSGLEIVRRYMNGKISLDTIRNKELIKTVNGMSYSIEMLKGFDKIYFAKEGSRLADKAVQKGLMVIDEDYLNFFRIVKDQPEMEKYRVSIMSKLPANLLDDEKDKVVKKEEVIKNVVYQVYYYAARRMNSEVFEGLSIREIKVGQSKTSKGWTDGSEYIVINKNVINEGRVFEEYIMDAYELLCHEYAHDTNSKETNTHGPEFYERFHQIFKDTCKAMGSFLSDNRFATLRREADSDGFLVKKSK